MRINTNIAALNTHRLMGQTNDAIARSIGRLSSGYRINSARDDAAGLAIANKFRADIRSFRVAQQNTTEANSLLQIAEGGANSIGSILERMKELATQAASANSEGQRDKINDEFTALKSEIDRIVDATTYQGQKLLDSEVDLTFQIGVASGAEDHANVVRGMNTSATPATGVSAFAWTGGDPDAAAAILAEAAAGQYTVVVEGNADGDVSVEGPGSDKFTVGFAAGGNFTISYDGQAIASFTVAADTDVTFDLVAIEPPHHRLQLTLDTSLDMAGLFGTDAPSVGDQEAAQKTLEVIDGAMDKVNEFLGKIGAYQNRLEYASANIAATIENYSASESVIRDADMAFEMTTFTRNQIMQQAAIAMLAQANMAPQSVLQLLG